MENEYRTDKYGNKYWENDRGKYHRDHDLPAIEYHNGAKAWYKNGKRHREVGPALIFCDGKELWFLNGIQYEIIEKMPTSLFMTYCKWELNKNI